MVRSTGGVKRLVIAERNGPKDQSGLFGCKSRFPAFLFFGFALAATLLLQPAPAVAEDVKANLNHEMTGTVVD